MSGKTNLVEVLKSLKISCDEIEYGFATIKERAELVPKQVLGIFQEGEGLTIIASKDYLNVNNLSYDGTYAKLTILVHTSLELVGLTAVLAAKLAENNISANVVAAYYHDHIFVPYALKDKAKSVLNQFKD